MDDPSEQGRLLDQIAARIMPELQMKIGEAYLRGWPCFIRYGGEEDGLTIDVIPADQFYRLPDKSPAKTD